MKYTRQNPYYATLKDRCILNKPGSTKKTFHISLKVNSKEINYVPGDSIGVIPLNDKVLVDKTLQTLNISSLSEQEIKLIDSVNICKGTKKLLQLILDSSKNNYVKNELKTLLENRQSLKKILNSYHAWELLEMYPSFFSLKSFCDTLQPMLPRFYSIASSNKTNPDEIHLLVAQNTYYLRDRICLGVGSNYLCNIAEINDRIAVYILENPSFSLPKEPEVPIIMIGPGTGLAPFRAFLQERCESLVSTKNWLFFGERNRNYDYYYQYYLESLSSKNLLTLDVAFSRDQKQKFYVQDLIQKKGKEFYEWVVNNAIIYVCGDAKQMAKSVEKAILDVFQIHGKMSSIEANNYLKNLRKNKRYLCDVY